MNEPIVNVRDLIITPLHAGSGLIYVLNFDPTTTPANNAQSLVTELAPATSTAPGGIYHLDRSNDGQKPVILNEWAIDGSHTGDTVSVSWELG